MESNRADTSSPALDDWSLLKAAGKGFSGWEILFERHKDRVLRLAWSFLRDRDLADDATQEVFLRMAEGRSRWRRRALFTTWLYQLTLNTCRELRRRDERGRRLASALEKDPAGRPIEAGAGASDPFENRDLARALAELPERQREAVILRFFEGLDTRETARVLGCRPGTVKSHLHRAVATLRRLLGERPAAIRGELRTQQEPLELS